jgi:hypothetical protein
MKNRILIWVMNFISKKLDPSKLEKYKRYTEGSFNAYLVLLFVMISFMIALVVLAILGLDYSLPLISLYYLYVLFLVSYLRFKWYSILYNKVREMSAIKDTFSNIFGGNLGMFDGGEGLLNMLKDLNNEMPPLDESLSEIKESYDKNVSENDDFLKEIEKNIGKF